MVQNDPKLLRERKVDKLHVSDRASISVFYCCYDRATIELRRCEMLLWMHQVRGSTDTWLAVELYNLNCMLLMFVYTFNWARPKEPSYIEHCSYVCVVVHLFSKLRVHCRDERLLQPTLILLAKGENFTRVYGRCQIVLKGEIAVPSWVWMSLLAIWVVCVLRHKILSRFSEFYLLPSNQN